MQTQPNIMEDQRHNYLAEVRALRTREAGYGNPEGGCVASIRIMGFVTGEFEQLGRC